MKKLVILLMLAFVSISASAQNSGGSQSDTENVLWQAGERFGFYSEVRRLYDNVKINRTLLRGRDILVVRQKPSGKLLDVWVRVEESGYVAEEMEHALIKLLSGIWVTPDGKRSEFGVVSFSHDEIMKGGFYAGDPHSELDFQIVRDYRRIHFTGRLFWGRGRIVNRYDAPADAPPGWGGHGSIAGPTEWMLAFTDEGLEVDELYAPMYCETDPDFGKHFTLRKIRSAYEQSPDPWAVTSEEILLPDFLAKFKPALIREMLDELKARHADGSPLNAIETLNRELLQKFVQ